MEKSEMIECYKQNLLPANVAYPVNNHSYQSSRDPSCHVASYLDSQRHQTLSNSNSVESEHYQRSRDSYSHVVFSVDNQPHQRSRESCHCATVSVDNQPNKKFRDTSCHVASPIDSQSPQSSRDYSRHGKGDNNKWRRKGDGVKHKSRYWKKKHYAKEETPVVFKGFNNRYSKQKVVGEMINSTSKGFLHFVSINEHLILRNGWEREIIPRQRYFAQTEGSTSCDSQNLHSESTIDINATEGSTSCDSQNLHSKSTIDINAGNLRPVSSLEGSDNVPDSVFDFLLGDGDLKKLDSINESDSHDLGSSMENRNEELGMVMLPFTKATTHVPFMKPNSENDLNYDECINTKQRNDGMLNGNGSDVLIEKSEEITKMDYRSHKRKKSEYVRKDSCPDKESEKESQSDNSRHEKSRKRERKSSNRQGDNRHEKRRKTVISPVPNSSSEEAYTKGPVLLSEKREATNKELSSHCHKKKKKKKKKKKSRKDSSPDQESENKSQSDKSKHERNRKREKKSSNSHKDDKHRERRNDVAHVPHFSSEKLYTKSVQLSESRDTCNKEPMGNLRPLDVTLVDGTVIYIKTEADDLVQLSDNMEVSESLVDDKSFIQQLPADGVIRCEIQLSDTCNKELEGNLRPSDVTLADSAAISIKTEVEDFVQFSDNIEVSESLVDNKSSIQQLPADGVTDHGVLTKTEPFESIETYDMNEQLEKKNAQLTHFTNKWLNIIDENYKRTGSLFSDLCHVMQDMGLDIWRDCEYPEIYNWEVNMRRMFVALFTQMDLKKFTQEIHQFMRDYPDLNIFFTVHKSI